MTRPRYQSAVGVSYNLLDGHPPILSIKGERDLADKIVRYARRFGVPVVEDSFLTNGLMELEVEGDLPSEYFEPLAVAIMSIGKTLKRVQAARKA